MADPTTPPPLWDLDTAIRRQTVRADGIVLELRDPDEFSVVDFQRLQKPGRRANELEAIDEPTPEQSAEYDAVLSQMCQQILVGPADVIRRLKKTQKAAIVSAFMRLRVQAMAVLSVTGAKTTPAPTPAAAEADAMTGASTSRG